MAKLFGRKATRKTGKADKAVGGAKGKYVYLFGGKKTVGSPGTELEFAL